MPKINEEKSLDVKKIIKRLATYLKPEKKKIIGIVIVTIISTMASVACPLLIGIAIDQYIQVNNLDGLKWLLFVLGMLFLMYAVFTWLNEYIVAKISQKTMFRLRRQLFNHLQKLSLSFYDQNQTGDIMSRFTNDITAISDTLSTVIIESISSIITIIGVAIIMFVINPVLATLVILTIPLLLYIVMKIGKKASIYAVKQQDAIGKVNSYAEEMISGMRAIKSLVREDVAIADFEEHNQQLKDVAIKEQLYSSLIFPANMAITNINNIMIVGIGAFLVVSGNITVGLILSFINYASQFRMPINQLASIYASIQVSLAGADRIFEIFDTEITVKDIEDSIELGEIVGHVKLDHVNFSYTKNKPVLKDINIDVRAGTNVALVGPTGAGKTTIINLLTRFYDVDSGNIYIDDIDISQVKQEELRQKIGIVLQDTYLFKGTVKDNIRYSKMTATDEEIIKASKKSQAHSFIHRLPDGYDSVVEEEGSNFSQGQRQLIAIARAILADPEILILDEATSSVDTKTELEIQVGMKELMKGRTSFVIAHRLSTIKEADIILVINDGMIIETGTHEQLLNNKGFYYQLYMSQFNN